MRVTPISRRDREMDSGMTPLIDVVFLLLVFFVWTSSFQAVEAILPSRLSAATGGREPQPIAPLPEQDYDPVVIRVRWLNDTAEYLMNGAPLESAEQLGAALRQIHSVQPEAPIVIHPDPSVPLALVVQAYDLARVAGFAKVSLAAALRADP
jgi:biopolymer transport protein ExbD